MSWLGDFRERVVLVTGASSGIGRATALAFADAGAHVALVARRADVLDAVAAEAPPHAGRLLSVPTDVGDPDQVRACFARVHDAFGRIDVVVNNAGLLRPGPVTSLAAEDLDAMLRVNLYGALFTMQEAVRVMAGQPDGSIVNVASLAGRRGVSPLGGYCATKFALVGITEALRTELLGSSLHVGLVLPGVVDTPMATGETSAAVLAELWPASWTMPPAWVVWAIFAAVRFRLTEVSVPPGAATFEKIAALAPGMADTMVDWIRRLARWVGP